MSITSNSKESTRFEEDKNVDPETLDDAEEKAFERATIRKIDRRILPLLGLLYAVSLIDRTNLAVARNAGMNLDLRLDIGARYSIVSAVYFIPYILLQIPSNYILRKVKPHHCLSFYVVAWGASTLGMGFVKKWGYLALCRVLLGVFEAGFFPALVFIITTWYKRHEVSKRLAFFYLISIVIAGFSSILAYAMQLLRGKGGLNGWSWIFILLGIITIVLGIVAFFFVPDFPDRNRFLTPKQTALILRRVEEDRGDSMPDEMSPAKVLHHLKDWTIWAYAFMFMCSTSASYAMGFFIPIILAGMGWGVKESLLLTAPPYAFAAITAFSLAWASDKMKHRAGFIGFQAIVSIIGLVVAGYAPAPGVRYFGLFLVNAGGSGCVPGVLAYSANNVVSHSKRSVSTALVISFGGIGGIFATTVFRQQDFPRYLNGIWATIGCQLLMLVLLVATTLNFRRKNRLMREGLCAPLEGQPGFYYTL